jgi:alpha-ketoglutarate-dependent taurine dioxygenase
MWIILIIATFFRVLLIAPQNQAMNTTYGTKETIPDSEMEKVRKVIWKNLVAYEWRQGDVVLLDNQRVSHGRLPFTGPRQIICAWGDALKKK